MSVKQVVMAAAGALGGAGEGAYVEDVFSTYLYTGNGSTQTITNGIDLAGEGGLVWIKSRNATYTHRVFDTVRGATKFLVTNDILAEDTNASTLTAFTSSGFSVGASTAVGGNGTTYASWTFRKAPKFFDVVTYTGSSSTQNISHNLGSVPGMIIVKRLNLSEEWFVYHRSTGASQHLKLNDTDGAGSSFQPWNNTAPTDSVFTVLGGRNEVNNAGSTYVAYLFAHDAGGFGDDGEQNVISCGSYTGNGSSDGPTINLGWEPQWLMVKCSSNNGGGDPSNWWIIDNMRGWTTDGNNVNYLEANTSSAELNRDRIKLTSTGFKLTAPFTPWNGSGETYIYIAIRRGPMKTPESGTEVFAPLKGAGTTPGFITGWPVDTLITGYSPGYTGYPPWGARLTADKVLTSSATGAETTNEYYKWDYNNGSLSLAVNSNYVGWNLRRAPGFFDVVAYTGDGSSVRTVNHNLGVVPEMVIVKRRNQSDDWVVYHSALGNTNILVLNDNGGELDRPYFNDTTPTNAYFTVNGNGRVNNSGNTYIAYLFASCPGVSKVGSYVGTGADLNIDCGFSSGARFVLIKRYDNNGDWYVWDSARGIVAGNDPYLLLNSYAAENTSTDYIDPLASGFTVTSSAPSALNLSGGDYIFLAIA